METLLVAMDDSPCAREALEFALEEFPDATIRVIHVPQPTELSGGSKSVEVLEERAAELFEDAEAIADEYGRTVETDTTYGNAAKAIVAYADDHDVDAIVVGCRGRAGAKRVLLGSVAETVVRRATCPVLVVR